MPQVDGVLQAGLERSRELVFRRGGAGLLFEFFGGLNREELLSRLDCEVFCLWQQLLVLLHLAQRLAVDRVEGAACEKHQVFLDVRATGLSGEAFANSLLDTHHIATMPGESFGQSAYGHIRVAMTVADDRFKEALQTLVDHAEKLAKQST